MSLQDELFSLEEDFWTGGGDHYRRFLADAVVMVLPQPAGVMMKEAIVSSLDTAPRWSEVLMEEHRLLELDEDCAMVIYKATARRADETYAARASSTYVRGANGWKLAFHQQTPA